MKKFKRFLYFLAALMTILWLTGNNHLYKGLYDTYLQGRTKPAIDDPDLFYTRTIVNKASVRHWPKSVNYNTDSFSVEAMKANEEISTVAFLTIKKDSLLFEKYLDGYDSASISNSFSMAKTFLSMLTGRALTEGKITEQENVAELVKPYVEASQHDLQVQHLLSMTSGINFSESYGNPFGFMAKAYYGTDLKELLKGYQIATKPGTLWKYLGGNNLLLSHVLEQKLGMKVGDYASASLWTELGMEREAKWILDHKNGDEKTFSGLYATARDFAKLGQLYAHKGVIDGKQIIDADFVQRSITPVMVEDEQGKTIDHYGYAWWLTTFEGKKVFYMQGILGQYVICIPELELIIVRLGRKRMDKTNGTQPDDLYLWIREGIRIAA